MFSIIIPLYNKEKYIAKAIQSVLDQTYTNWELIVVNDGSTDNSSELVKNLQLSALNFQLLTQPNQGVSMARNNGVKAAKYNYIAFLDADDWWAPTFLQEMAQTIKEYPDAALYGNRFWIVKNGKKKLSDVGVQNNFYKGYINYIKTYTKTYSTPFNCSFVIIRKNEFEKENGFKPALKFGEDFDLWIRMALKHKVAYCNKPLSYSNQDVEAGNRALGQKKLYKKEAYFIFNLGYLQKETDSNQNLKTLTDGLYVRGLLRYYLANTYKKEVKTLLKTVNWQKQSKYYQRIYTYPKFLVIFYFFAKTKGYQLKLFIKNAGQ